MSINERFEAFHDQNPWVASELAKMARRLKARGHRRIGIELLWAGLRWQSAIGTYDAHSNFRLNDHYTSRYARLLPRLHPDLAGLFETRQLRTA